VQILPLYFIGKPVMVLSSFMFFKRDLNLSWLFQGLVHTEALVTVFIKNRELYSCPKQGYGI
jgi:hypothetical protein